MTYRPHLLPKIRSEAIMASAKGQPCTLRISSIFPSHKCSSRETTVWVHMDKLAGGLGKGTSTKVSDPNGCYGCANCHALVEMADNRIFYIQEKYPMVLTDRLLKAVFETQALLIEQGIVIIPDGEVV